MERTHETLAHSEVVGRSADQHTIKQLFEASPVPMIITSPQREGVVAFNTRAREVFHVTEEEARTRPMVSYYVNPADRPPILATIQRDGHIDDVKLQMQRP